MKRLVWAALAGLFVVPGAAFAQEPKAAVTAGFSYIASREGAPGHADVRGGYVQPAFNLGYGLAVYGNAGFHHGEDQYGTFSLQQYGVGLSKRIASSPFGAVAIFGDVGDTRVSYHPGSGPVVFGTNRVQNGFTFNAGPVFAVSLNPNVALSLTPIALTVRNHVVDPTTSLNLNGDTRAGYAAKIGITIFFGDTRHSARTRRY